MPLHVMPAKLSAYVKIFDGKTKWIYVLFEDDDWLEKYNTIWDKVSADIKKEHREKKVIRLFIDDLQSSSANSDDSDGE